MTMRWARAAALVAIAALAALAADGPAWKDELARELWEAWRARQYDLTSAGARTASCTIHANLGEPPGRTAEATGKYTWDGERGSLVWDDAQVGGLLTRQGWNAGKIDMWFAAGRLVKLDGAQVTATRTDDGATLRVDTGKPSGLFEVRFDGDGILTTAVYRDATPRGPVDTTLTFRYGAAGGKLVLCGWSMELRVGDSPYSEKNDVTLVEHGGFHVPARVASTSTVGAPPNAMEMKKTLTFSEWRINGETLEDAPDVPDTPEVPGNGG